MFEFKYADKNLIESLLPGLFKILHSNMSVIAPTNNSFEKDFEIWSENVGPALKKDARKIVLMYCEEKLAGYFQYYINAETNSLMMEEIQIKKEYQGNGLFNAFYKWLIKELPIDIKNVEAYANKKNYKSQSILKYLGLSESGENKNGNSFYYKGDYKFLYNLFDDNSAQEL